MKIVGFNGSLSKESNSLKGLKVSLEACKRLGAEVFLYNLRELPLPIFDPDLDDTDDPNVQTFTKLLDEADGIILASPDYHNTIGGAFKNALDWVGSKQFKKKPVALISATGGPSSMSTLNTMQLMMRSLHAWIIPVLGSIPGNTQFNPDGSFADPRMQQRFETIGREMVEAVQLLRERSTANAQI
jgi:FMN reductase